MGSQDGVGAILQAHDPIRDMAGGLEQGRKGCGWVGKGTKRQWGLSRSSHVGHVRETGFPHLLGVDVKGGAGQVPALQSSGGGLNVNDAAARGVDEVASLLHLRCKSGPSVDSMGVLQGRRGSHSKRLHRSSAHTLAIMLSFIRRRVEESAGTCSETKSARFRSSSMLET